MSPHTDIFFVIKNNNCQNESLNDLAQNMTKIKQKLI